MASSSGSSSTDSDEISTTQSKQVQFGVSQKSEESEEDDSFRKGSIESDNVNERLRHHLPQVQQEFDVEIMDRVTADICIYLLQNCYQRVSFFRTMNKMPKVLVSLEYVPLDDKYKNAEHEIGVILHPTEEFLSYRKFQKELSWMENVLQAIILDLQNTYYFDEFLKILNEENCTRQEEQTLSTSKKFNQEELKRLKTYLELERRELTREIQDVTKEMGNLKDQLNDDILESAIKLNYVKAWQKSRNEQNSLVLSQAEQKLNNTTKHMDQEIEKEIIIHEDLYSYLETSLEEFRQDINNWMDKYDVDMEEIEKTVEKKKIDVEQQRENYQKLLEEYNTRQQMMDEYKAHKIEMQREAEELQRQTEAATKIQAWWRGIMFRKGLGPYRRRKGKGKKGSGRRSGKKAKK